ncbi:hypothetical protein [Candidatus Lokiarchaeum ossiferum]|uniref:hypothetical protein n=1 Tax=Candidatus Lokiarchaeum ossiferum TaxID=2951803 RepID=UPI00352C392E
MSEDSNNSKYPEEKKKELEQTQELKNMLSDLDDDGIPKLKTTTSADVGKVSTPSFLKEDQPSESPFPEEGKIKLIGKPLISPKQITLKPPTSVPEQPTIVKSNVQIDDTPTGNFWGDSEIFFKQLGKSYEDRYSLWNQTSSSILTILRKMRRINESNTENLIKSINDLELKLNSGLKDFSMKRNEVERFSDIDYKRVIKDFKKTMDLLNMQIREFKLQQSISELYDIYVN